LPPPPSSTSFPYTTLFRSPVCIQGRCCELAPRRSRVGPSSPDAPVYGPQHEERDDRKHDESSYQERVRHSDIAGGWPTEVTHLADRKSTRLNSSHVAISYA